MLESGPAAICAFVCVAIFVAAAFFFVRCGVSMLF
jgi:hypothetical protein